MIQGTDKTTPRKKAVPLPRIIVPLFQHPREFNSLSMQIVDCCDGHRTMLSTTLIFVSLLICASNLLFRRRPKVTKNALDKNVDDAHTEEMLATRYQQPDKREQPHKLVSAFTTLLDQDGAGTWPPRANHSSWPTALRPYKEVYLEMVPYLSAATPSLDDAVNQERRSAFRSAMRRLLAERVNQVWVTRIMRQLEAGNVEILPQDQINGFYCAVAVCRHAYRYRFPSLYLPVLKLLT